MLPELTCTATFVFLALFDNLLGDILTRLPVNLAALARNYLGTLVSERVILINHILKLVGLRQDFVFKKVVLRELEFEGEGHLIAGIGQFGADVNQLLENWLVMFLDDLVDWRRRLEDGEPELGNASDFLRFGSFLFLSLHHLLDNVIFIITVIPFRFLVSWLFLSDDNLLSLRNQSRDSSHVDDLRCQ